jgi:hypothetical protein
MVFANATNYYSCPDGEDAPENIDRRHSRVLGACSRTGILACRRQAHQQTAIVTQVRALLTNISKIRIIILLDMPC